MSAFSTEEDLFEAFRRGEPKAFDFVYKEHCQRLVNFAYKMTGDEAEAQDIASETFKKLFERYQNFASKKHYECFLFITARNASINYLRDKRASIQREKEFGLLTVENSAEIELDEELIRKLLPAIEQLPPRSRDVINYLFRDRLSYQEVAEKMETTIKNVENLRTYALRKLRDDLRHSYKTFF